MPTKKTSSNRRPRKSTRRSSPASISREKGEAGGLALLLFLEGVAALFWTWAIAGALADRRVMRRLRCDHAGAATPTQPPENNPTVAAIIPARNEAANIGPCVAALRAQAALEQIVIADDSSEDDTAAIAAAAGADDPRVRVMRCTGPPPGWIGKCWAANYGAAHTRSQWLLFCDADMRLDPGTVSAALQVALATQADALSLTATLECGSLAEEIVMPVMAALVFGAYPAALVNDRRFSTALLAGGFVLVRREAYKLVGGHAAVRNDIAEDRGLARRLKAFGYRLHLVDGSGCVRVRMYRGLSDMWLGWRKNVYEGVHRRPAGAAAFVVLTIAMLVIPMPLTIGLAVRGLQRPLRKPQARLLTLAAFGSLSAVLVRRVRDRFIGAGARAIPLTPLGGLFAAAVMAASAWRMESGLGQLWKGRTIS